MVENFPNMEKEIVNQIQEGQRVLIKLIKTKHKERIVKAEREKQQVT